MHGNTVPDAPATGSVLPSLSAPEPEDVKPVIPRPFPMAAPDTPRMNGQNRKRTHISASPAASLSRSPLRRVKREPSLVVTRLVPSSMEPIYISSDEDEDEEEVHKQIEASTSQATSARSSEKEAAVSGDQDQEEPDDEDKEGEERRGEEAAEEEEQNTAAEAVNEKGHDENAAEEPKVKEEKVPQGAALENDEEEEEEEEGGEGKAEEENVPQVAALEEPEEDEEEGEGEAPKDQAEDPEEDELEEEGVDDDKMVEEDGVDDGKVDEDEDEDEKLPKEDDDKMAEDEDENEDEELPAEDDKEEDSEAEENSANPHLQKSQSPSKSPSRSPSSSPPPPDPFSLARSSSIPKPQPRPKAPSSSLPLSQPPPKRRLSSTNTFAIPATQPVASSRRSHSVKSQSRASTGTAIGNASTIEEDEEVEVEEVEIEEDDKRYAKRPKTQTPFTSTLTGIAPISPTRGKHIAHPKEHLRKHPDYWLLDGSVTLQLESTLFRLHRSRLVTQSTYFQELFAAQPDMLGEGCAYRVGSGEEEEWVYVTKGVSVGDFEELLRALDNAISYVYDPPPFFKLAAILRASLTLHFPSLSSFVIRTLRTTWPVSLSQLTATRIPHAAETIILARTCEGSGLGLHDIMKRAFYELVRTARMGEDVDADEEDPDVMSGQVSRQDLARLIRAREELVSRWVAAAVSPPDIVCSQDGHVPIDKAKLLECWHEKVVRGGVFEEGMYDPIVGLQRLGEVRWEEQVCKGCVGAWREVWEKMRVKLWGQLDLWLGLPEGEGEKGE